MLYYHPFLTRPVIKIFNRLIFSLGFELIFLLVIKLIKIKDNFFSVI